VFPGLKTEHVGLFLVVVVIRPPDYRGMALRQWAGGSGMGQTRCSLFLSAAACICFCGCVGTLWVETGGKYDFPRSRRNVCLVTGTSLAALAAANPDFKYGGVAVGMAICDYTAAWIIHATEVSPPRRAVLVVGPHWAAMQYRF
jgi:hypothetical protein